MRCEMTWGRLDDEGDGGGQKARTVGLAKRPHATDDKISERDSESEKGLESVRSAFKHRARLPGAIDSPANSRQAISAAHILLALISPRANQRAQRYKPDEIMRRKWRN